MLCKVQYSTKSPHLQGLILYECASFFTNCVNEPVLRAFFWGAAPCTLVRKLR